MTENQNQWRSSVDTFLTGYLENYDSDNLLDAIVDVKSEGLFDAYIELGGKVATKNFGSDEL
jgi:hypothetical protein